MKHMTVGLVPFTKQVLWEIRAEVRGRAAAAATICVAIVPYNSLEIIDAMPRHHSSAQMWEDRLLDSDPQICKRAAAEARATKSKAETAEAAGRKRQKRIDYLTQAQTDAGEALTLLNGKHAGDVDRLHIPQLKAIIVNGPHRLPEFGQSKAYYLSIVKELLKNDPVVREFSAGMLDVEAPAEDDWEEEAVVTE